MFILRQFFLHPVLGGFILPLLSSLVSYSLLFFQWQQHVTWSSGWSSLQGDSDSRCWVLHFLDSYTQPGNSKAFDNTLSPCLFLILSCQTDIGQRESPLFILQSGQHYLFFHVCVFWTPGRKIDCYIRISLKQMHIFFSLWADRNMLKIFIKPGRLFSEWSLSS